MYLVFMAMLTVSMAQAVPAPSIGDAAVWKSCEKETSISREAKALEDMTGRTSVVQLVIDRCGYRPTVISGGRQKLAEQDCRELFDWATDGICSVEDTVGLDLATRTLDPRVFDRNKYRNRCERRAGGKADSYEDFRREVCEAAP